MIRLLKFILFVVWALVLTPFLIFEAVRKGAAREMRILADAFETVWRHEWDRLHGREWQWNPKYCCCHCGGRGEHTKSCEYAKKFRVDCEMLSAIEAHEQGDRHTQLKCL